MQKYGMDITTRMHSSRMRTDRAVTRSSSERVAARLIVDRQTPVKILPSLTVGKNCEHVYHCSSFNRSFRSDCP